MKWGVLAICFLLSVQAVAVGYQTFEQNGKVGIKDEGGRVVLAPTFDALGWSDGNFSVVNDITGYRKDGRWGLINIKTAVALPALYVALRYGGGESVIAVRQLNAKWKTGIINLHGEEKVPFVYDGIDVHGLRAIVFIIANARYNYGLIDLTNRTLLPSTYQRIWPLGTLRYAVEDDQHKIALFSDDGLRITPFDIDSISSFKKNFAVVYRNDRQGLIDREGLLKLEPDFASIEILDNGSVRTLRPSEWMMFKPSGEIANTLQASELKPMNGYIAVRYGKYWGLRDSLWKEIFPTQFTTLTSAGKDLFIVQKGMKVGLRNLSQELMPIQFDSIKSVHQQFAAFTEGRGWQLFNQSGTLLTSNYYQQIRALNDGWIAARSRGYWGVLNDAGKEKIHCVFDSLLNAVGKHVAVKFRNQFGIIDTDENWIVPPHDQVVYAASHDLYVEVQPGNFFVKNFSGSILYFTPYKLTFTDDTFTEWHPDGRHSTFTHDGKLSLPEAQPTVLNDAVTFEESEGLRGFYRDGRYGFVDHRGKMRIANRYDSIGEFHEGLAPIKLIGKWGFVNVHDQIVVNPNYDSPSRFYNGIAVVSRAGKYGLINQEGKAILPLRYSLVSRMEGRGFAIYSDARRGFADLQGRVMIEPTYDSLRPGKDGEWIACLGGKCGTLSDQGIHQIPMLYDQLIFDATRKIYLAERKAEWQLVTMP